MEKNYRIYSDSDSAVKSHISETKEKERIEASDRSQNHSAYYMTGNKDTMTSNKVFSMY